MVSIQSVVGNMVSENIPEMDQVTPVMGIEYLDPDYDGLYEQIRITVEVDIVRSWTYRSWLIVYEFDTNIWLFDSYQEFRFDVDKTGNQSFIFEDDFFSNSFQGNVSLNFNLEAYDQYSGDTYYIFNQNKLIYFDYTTFDTPIAYFDYSSMEFQLLDWDTQTYMDLNTTCGCVDFIVVTGIAVQKSYGRFNIEGDLNVMDVDYNRHTNNNWHDYRAAGNYTETLFFPAYGIGQLYVPGTFRIHFGFWYDFSWDNDQNNIHDNYYMDVDFFNQSSFDSPYYSFEFINVIPIDENSNGQIEAFEVVYNLNVYRNIDIGHHSWMNFIMDTNNRWEDGYFDLHAMWVEPVNTNQGIYEIHDRLDATKLYNRIVPPRYHVSIEINSRFGEMNFWDYTNINDLTLSSTSFEKPKVYLSNVQIINRYQDSVNLDQNSGYDYMEIRYDVESKMNTHINFQVNMLEVINFPNGGWNTNWLGNWWNDMDINEGINSYSMFVSGKELYNIYFEGQVGFEIYYNYAEGNNNFDSDYRFLSDFNSNQYNPNGQIDTNKPNNGGETSSEDESSNGPTLDFNLPSPSIYLTLFSILTLVAIVSRKQRYEI